MASEFLKKLASDQRNKRKQEYGVSEARHAALPSSRPSESIPGNNAFSNSYRDTLDSGIIDMQRARSDSERQGVLNNLQRTNRSAAVDAQRYEQQTRMQALQQLQDALNNDVNARANQIRTGSPMNVPMTTFSNKNDQAAYDQFKSTALKNALDNVVANNKFMEPITKVREQAKTDPVAQLRRYNAERKALGLEPESLSSGIGRASVKAENDLKKETLTKDEREKLRSFEAKANEEEMTRSIEEARQMAERNPLLGTGISTFGSLAGTAIAAPATIGRMASGEQNIDINDPLYRLARQAQAAREGTQTGVKNNLGIEDYDAHGNRTLASQASDLLTGTGLSILDTTIRSAFMGPLAGAAQAAISAGTQGFIQRKEQGFDDQHALATGIAEGIAEGLFEKVSLEGLHALQAKPADGLRTFLLNMAKQSFTEGSEELFTDWANAVSDYMINGGDSEFSKKVSQYILTEGTREKAVRRALKDILVQSGVSFLGGAISGGVLGGGAQLASVNYNRQTGQQLINDNQAFDHDSLLDAAESIDISPETYMDNRGNVNEEALQQAKDTKAYLEDLAKSVTKRDLKPGEQGAAINEMMRTYDAAKNAGKQELYVDDAEAPDYEAEQKQIDDSWMRPEDKIAAAAERQALKQFEEAENVKLPKSVADNMVDAYDPIANRHNLRAYRDAYKRAFVGGSNGVDFDVTVRSPLIKTYMTNDQILQAYKDGVKYASDDRTPAFTQGPARQGGLVYASENATAAQKKIAHWVGDKTGLTVEIRDDIEGGGDIDLKKGVLRLNPNSKNFNQTVSHELTHLIRQFAPKEYETYKNLVVEALMNSRGESYDRLYAQYESRYGETGTTPNVDDVIEEMVADGSGQFLNDEAFINKITKQDRSLAEKIVDFFQGIVNALKDSMSQQGLSRTSQALRENYERYSKALDVWSNALTNASESYKNGTTIESEIRYSIQEGLRPKLKRIFNNKIDQNKDIVLGDTSSFIKNVLRAPGEISKLKVSISQRKAYLNMATREKAIADGIIEENSSETMNCHGLGPKLYYKALVASEHPVAAYVSVNQQTKSASLNRITLVTDQIDKSGNPIIVGMEFKTTGRFGSRTLEVNKDVSVYGRGGLHTAIEAAEREGRLLYFNIDKYKSSLYQEGKARVQFPSIGSDIDYNYNIEQFWKNFKTTREINAEIDNKPTNETKHQLDMSEPVEQVKNLIAIRNVDSKNIMSMLDLEGLPSPSIAITKDSIGHTAFGDITFIFGRSTIDPQADKRNLVFDADAWTPLYPGIEYDYDRKRIHEGYNQLRSMVSEGILPSYYADRANAFLNRIEFSNSSSAEQIIEDAKSNYGMKAYYLASRGESVEVRSNTTSESMTDEDAALAQRIISEIGEDRLREGILGHPEMREDIKNILRDRYASDLGYTEAEADEAVENMDKKEIGKAYMLAKSFLKHGQTKTETTYDYDATERAIDEKIDDADYTAWLHEQFDSLVTERGIRNTKDPFTNSGNRRSFKQLHDPVTAENIVRAMWTGREQGAVAFSGMTAKSVRGASARKYSSVEEMHRDADRLQNVSDGSLFSENEKKLLERSDDRLHAVKQEVFDNNGITFKNVDRYANYERAYTEALLDAASKKMSWQKIHKTFSDSGINLTEAQAKEIFDILDELRNLPTDYFEAKPKRVVQWGEIGLAVIPDNADPKIAQRLREVGVQKIETYPAGDDQARLEIERKAESLKFQLDMDEPGEGFDGEGIGKDNRDLEAAAKTLGEILSDIDQVPSKTAISKTASAIRKATGTKESLSKIRDEISTIYEYLAFSRNIDGAEISSILADLAGDLITNSDSGINPADQEVYNEFRNILRSHTFHMPAGFEGELETLGGIGALRREFFGTLNITKEKGSTIDQLWEELADQYPEYFDRDVVNPADQLERIVDMIRSLKPSADTSSMTDEDYEIHRYSVGQDILKAFIENSQRTDLKDEYQQKLEKGLQKAKEKVQEQRRKEKIRKLDREARSDLLKKAQRLSRMKGGPEFEAAKQELIGNLDLVAKGIRSDTKAKLEALRAKAEELAASDEDYKKLYYENAKDVFSRLEKVHIKDMTGEDVADLTNKIIELIYQERAAKRMLNDEMGHRIATVGRRAISQQSYAKGINGRNEIGSTFGRYALNMLNPTRAMQMLDGYQQGGVFTQLGNQLNEGQTKQKTFIMNASKKFNGFLETHPDLVKTWNTQDIDTGLKDEDGNPVYISKGMRISMYLHNMNTQNRRHIAEGGLEIPDAKLLKKGKISEAYRYATTVKLKPTDISRITDGMTDDEIAFARLAHEFLNKDTKDAINETSLTLSGTLKAIVDDYFPIRTDKNFTMGGDISGLIQDGTIEGMGMLKERIKGAAVPILLEDVAQVLQRQINNTALYYGLAVPVRDANKVLKFKEAGNADSVRNSVNKTWGDAGIKYIEGVLRDIQTGAPTDSGPAGEIINKLKSTYAGTVLNWNLGVAIKQSASAPFAAVVLDAKSIAKAFAKNGFSKADYDYMDSITPWSYMRRQGMSGTEMGEVYKQKNMIQQNRTLQKVKNATNWIQNVDVWTTDRLFFATEYYVQEHYPNLKVRGDEYNQKVAELYNDMLQRTQPSYDVMQRNAYLRSENGFAKIAGMFKTQTFNMGGEVINSWAKLKATEQMFKDHRASDTEVKKVRAQFGRTVAATVTSQMMLTVLAIVAKAIMHNMKNYRDDKGEVTPESIAARGIYEFLTSFSGMTIGGSELQSFGIALTGKEKWYDLEYPGLAVINDLVSSSVDMTNAYRKAVENNWDTESANKFRKKAIEFGMNAAIAKRIPADNIYKLGNAFYLWYQDWKNGKLGTFDAGEGLFGLKDSSVTKEQYARQVLSAVSEGDTKKADYAMEHTTKTQIESVLGAEADGNDGSKQVDALKKIDAMDISVEDKVKIAERVYGFEGLTPENWSDYVKILDTKVHGKQDGVIEYLDGSNLPEDVQRNLWENASGYSKDTFDKKVGQAKKEETKTEAKAQTKTETKQNTTSSQKESKSAADDIEKELTEGSVKEDKRYAYIVDQVTKKKHTAAEAVEWFKSDEKRTNAAKYKAWKSAGGTDYDYIKTRADLTRFEGSDKQEKIARYLKKQNISDAKKRVIWFDIMDYSQSKWNKYMQ